MELLIVKNVKFNLKSYAVPYKQAQICLLSGSVLETLSVW